MDLDRVKYLLSSYLRTRLSKIQDKIFFIEVEDGIKDKLSNMELDFAEKLLAMKRDHIDLAFMKRLPKKHQEMDFFMSDMMIKKPYTPEEQRKMDTYKKSVERIIDKVDREGKPKDYSAIQREVAIKAAKYVNLTRVLGIDIDQFVVCKCLSNVDVTIDDGEVYPMSKGESYIIRYRLVQAEVEGEEGSIVLL